MILNVLILQTLKCPHLLDPMHVEKNISAAIFKTFSNCKGTKADSMRVREALEELGIRRSLQPFESFDHDGKRSVEYVPAPWVWTKEELDEVIETVRHAKTPTGYGSSFMYKFSEGKLTGMKTHDYHNLIQDILPVAIRGTLTAEVRNIVYRVGNLFRWICSKEIDPDDLPAKLEEAEIICLVELHMPPTVLDTQFHQLPHLVEEVGMAGPVSYRWMYFIERYMKELKDFVRQRAKPEGSMAEGYVASESMYYASEFVTRLQKSAPPAWVTEEDPKTLGLVLPTRRRLQGMDVVFQEQAHRFLLHNHPSMDKWRRK